jgi:TolA-binding protein
MLRIGLARSLTAWARYDEAAAHLSAVADDPANALAPEALYWLGVARYLQSRRRAPMMQAWNRLRAEHPASAWAARVPPNQEDEPEPSGAAE